MLKSALPLQTEALVAFAHKSTWTEPACCLQTDWHL